MIILKFFIFLLLFCLGHTKGRENQCLSPHFFDCGNNRCIAQFWRCDNEDDCGNWADEHNCDDEDQSHVSSKISCPKDYHHCNDSHSTCIPQKWICDGMKDCDNGSDESNCTATSTQCPGFTCKSLQCIPMRWRCDGIPDCNDNSDETNCTKIQKGHLCIKERGFYECISGECIPHNKVCNNHKDCPMGDDEGTECKSQGCHNKNCSHLCMPTPHGGQCYCKEGFHLGSNNRTCNDIDECTENRNDGICSQRCTNFEGSYKCDCYSGYELKDNKTCIVEESEPLLLFSDDSEIRGLWLKSKRYFLVHPSLRQAAGLDVYGAQDKVYWVDVDARHSGIYSSNLMGSEDLKPIVTTGLKSPEDIAIDWIGQNLYIVDADAKKIIVCKMDGTICATLIKDNIDLPRAIVVDPVNGILYWTEWGKNPGIFKSWTDGTHQTMLIKDDIRWPNGLAYDNVINRLYWSDAKLKRIEYYDLVTKERTVLLQDTVYHPFSLTVFEDTLYWSDWITFSIEMCNKFTGRNQSTLIRQRGQHIMGLHVHHPVNQRPSSNPCWVHQCSHLCLIKPGRKYSCACPDHMVLSDDNFTCIDRPNNPFLFIGIEKSVKKFFPETIGLNTLIDVSIPRHLMIGDIAFDWKRNTLYIFDMNKYIIAGINLTSLAWKSIIDSHLDSVEGLTYDVHTNNLFWLEVNEGLLETATIDGRSRAVLIDRLERPIDLLLFPERRQLFIAVLGSEPHILSADTDGKNRKKLIASHIGLPVSLAIDRATQALYWADAKLELIEWTDLKTQHELNDQRIVVKENLGHVMSIEIVNNTLFWTDMNSNQLHHMETNNRFSKVLVTPIESKNNASHIKKLLFVNSETPRGPCVTSNGGCSHICLIGRTGATCVCPVGYVLKADMKTCEEEKLKCKTGEWMCKDGSSCILDDWICDGQNDCIDSSDEKDCHKCPDNDFKCANGKCIITVFHCDNVDDCGDGSDEIGCSNKIQCNDDDHFKCNDGRCLPKRWKCDGDIDCTNGEDEQNCTKMEFCHNDPFQMKCGDGVCVPLNWVCDGESDCKDSSDESNCHQMTCKPTDFRCRNNICIDGQFVCDKERDCSDGSDEEECAYDTTSCPPFKFTCKIDGHCIYQNEVCDGLRDCSDGEDEEHCSAFSCGEYDTWCSNNSTTCIPKLWLCDGENDCGDWSDETRPQCTKHISGSLPTTTGKPCRDGSYPCTSGECIPYDLVCNREKDCLDSSDEGSHCGYVCKHHNGGCAQICRDTPLGPSCACNNGYNLSNDGKTCEDINECGIIGQCSHYCENTKGSYKCSCADGYFLAGDRHKCKSNGTEAYVFLMLPDQIRSVGLRTQSQHRMASITDGDMKGMDYDFATARVFWTEYTNGTINSKSTIGEEKRQSKRSVIINGLNKPNQLSWDWIGRNFYFISNDSEIHVCSENGHWCTLILATGLTRISSFIASPNYGIMFWSVYSNDLDANSGRIDRADMDGSNRKIIANDKMQWPNGLTIDNVLERLYWVDTRLGEINVADFNGRHRKVLLQYSLSHPSSLAVFEDNLYWINFGTDTLMKCNKFTGGSRVQLHRGDVKAPILKVVHRNAQPKVENPCQNHLCDHLCLLKVGGYSCACKYNYALLPDNKHCVLSETEPSNFSYNSDNVCTQNFCQNGGECIVFNSGIMWQCLCPKSWSGAHCDIPLQQMSSEEESDGNGWISIFVGILIIAIAIVFVLILHRRNRYRYGDVRNAIYRRGNQLRGVMVNFENPIYKWAFRRNGSIVEPFTERIHENSYEDYKDASDDTRIEIKQNIQLSEPKLYDPDVDPDVETEEDFGQFHDDTKLI